ncbi:peptidoglycan bridge formation glycyltransferase FemA/FemB family protein [Propionivibrio sp.]|uniref:lipid II:glycine glycyltransferase FemX n=1 Tax=Propionivibrio sp. TaxID=2212460 RepID=UPI003412D9C0
MVIWSDYEGSSTAWDAAMAHFDSVNLYQLYAWGEARSTLGWTPVRLVARDEKQNIVALVQGLVRRAGLGISLCWIPGGPVGAIDVCGMELRSALRLAVAMPWLYCRMNALRSLRPDDRRALKSQGWKRPRHLLTSGLSLSYDLRPDEAARRAAASGNWRHNLRRSDKYGLVVTRWNDPTAEEISAIYREMEALKGLDQQHSLEEIRALLKTIGDRFILFRCRDASGATIALRGCGYFGTDAWDLLAAATPAARKVYASHAVLWALTGECRRLGVESYDLSGIDPKGNKGVYDFKKGTGAAHQQYLGEWEWSNLPGLCWAANLAMRYRKGRL